MFPPPPARSQYSVLIRVAVKACSPLSALLQVKIFPCCFNTNMNSLRNFEYFEYKHIAGKKKGTFGAGQFSLETLVGGRPGTTIFQNPGGGGSHTPPPPVLGSHGRGVELGGAMGGRGTRKRGERRTESRAKRMALWGTRNGREGLRQTTGLEHGTVSAAKWVHQAGREDI